MQSEYILLSKPTRLGTVVARDVLLSKFNDGWKKIDIDPSIIQIKLTDDCYTMMKYLRCDCESDRCVNTNDLSLFNKDNLYILHDIKVDILFVYCNKDSCNINELLDLFQPTRMFKDYLMVPHDTIDLDVSTEFNITSDSKISINDTIQSIEIVRRFKHRFNDTYLEVYSKLYEGRWLVVECIRINNTYRKCKSILLCKSFDGTRYILSDMSKPLYKLEHHTLVQVEESYYFRIGNNDKYTIDGIELPIVVEPISRLDNALHSHVQITKYGRRLLNGLMFIEQESIHWITKSLMMKYGDEFLHSNEVYIGNNPPTYPLLLGRQVFICKGKIDNLIEHSYLKLDCDKVCKLGLLPSHSNIKFNIMMVDDHYTLTSLKGIEYNVYAKYRDELTKVMQNYII